MKKFIRRVFNLHILALLSGLVIFFILFGSRAVSAEEQKEKSYLIKVNRYHNTITIYEKNENGKYNIPIKAMVCSVGRKGTETKKGTFQTQGKYRWKYLMGDVWGQYSTRIIGGILFHSVYYYEYGNPGTLATRQYNMLGSPASHGCIRLTVEDAKWIYDNCSIGTTVVIYDDKDSPGPLGKPKAVRLPANVRWDPTDPNQKNPYKDKKPTISGVKNQTIAWGEEADLLKKAKAKSTLGTDITDKLKIEGEINPYIAGDYEVIYSVTDNLGRSTKKTIIITVDESDETPEFVGINDRIISKDIIVNEDFALDGVEVICGDIRLKKSDIEVTIDELNEEEYKITYEINIGEEMSATEYATIIVDGEAPVITGITERILIPGQIPDEEFALTGVDISDNRSSLDQEDIKITILEKEEGSYQIIYEAIDEAGNMTKKETIFHLATIETNLLN